MTNKPLFGTSLLTHLLSFLLLVVHLTPVTVAQNEDEIVADETEQLPLGESVAFFHLCHLVVVVWQASCYSRLRLCHSPAIYASFHHDHHVRHCLGSG